MQDDLRNALILSVTFKKEKKYWLGNLYSHLFLFSNIINNNKQAI